MLEGLVKKAEAAPDFFVDCGQVHVRGFRIALAPGTEELLV